MVTKQVRLATEDRKRLSMIIFKKSELEISSKPNFWQVLQSILGALFGVQSSKVRERDFTRGHPWWVYLGTGVLVVILLILLLIGLAKWILWQAAV
jgi:hypothetical protein